MNWFFWPVLAAALAVLPLVVRRPVVGVYGAFALAGVLMSPALPLVGERLAIADILIVPAVVLAAVAVVRAPRRAEMVRVASVRYALAVIAVFWVLSLVSAVSGVSAFGADTRRSAISVANYLYGALMAGAVLVLVDDWAKWRTCLIAWVAGAGVVGLFAASALAGMGPEWASPAGSDRVMSTARRINQVHSYAAPAMAVAFAWLFSTEARRWWRAVAALVFVLAAIALVATAARTALVLLVVALFGVAVYALRHARRSPLVASAALALALAGMVTVGSVTVAVARGQSESLPAPLQAATRPVRLLLEAEDFDTLFGARSPLMRTAAEQWNTYPLLGVGPGNFRDYYEQTHELHNTYLGVLMEHGVTGFLLLAGFLACVVAAGIRAVRRGAPPGGPVFTVMALFAFTLILIYGLSTFGLRQRIFWLCAGLLLSAARISGPASGTRNG